MDALDWSVAAGALAAIGWVNWHFLWHGSSRKPAAVQEPRHGA